MHVEIREVFSCDGRVGSAGVCFRADAGTAWVVVHGPPDADGINGVFVDSEFLAVADRILVSISAKTDTTTLSAELP